MPNLSTMHSCPFQTISQGGYHLDSLGESVAESFRALLGLPSESPAAGDLLSRRLLHEEPLRKVEQVVGRVRKLHRLG